MRHSALVATFTAVLFLSDLACAQEESDAGAESESGAIIFFVIVPLIIALVWLGRYIVIRRVRALMRVKSDEQGKGELPGQDAREVLAEHQPEFLELGASSELPEAVAKRESLVAAARKLSWRAYRYELLIAGAYIAIPVAFQFLPFPETYGDEAVGLGLMLGIPFAFISTIRVLTFRSQFKAHNPGVLSFFGSILRRIADIADPKYRLAISAILIAAAIAGALLYASLQDSTALILAASAHAFLMWHLARSLRGGPNLKLVVLRVFGIDDTAEFTFEGLLDYWKHFGSFFTVVDASFLRSQNRKSNRLAPTAMAVAFLLIIAEVELKMFQTNPRMFLLAIALPVIVAAIGLQVYLSIKMAERSFVRSQDDLDARLQKLDAMPRKLDLTFRSMPTMCHDNTWRLTVAEFVARSQVVLMDLRGYSEERKGCEYEVDFLLDATSIEKIVFLAYPDGLSMVKELILKRWEYLRENSPNLGVQAPTVRIYVAERENRADMQGIMDVLLDAAI